MWVTAEIINKGFDNGGYVISIQYGTDDVIPLTKVATVFLGPGQDESTLKAAIIQQLADFNLQDVKKNEPEQVALENTVAAILLGPVDLK